MAMNHNATSSRRGLLKIAATAVAAAPAAVVAAPLNVSAPALASPEITAAIADYWARAAECNARGVSDELIDAKCDEIEDAAARIAAAPCRSVADLAAKIVFFVEVMNQQNVWHSVTHAEGNVLVSVKAGVMALARSA